MFIKDNLVKFLIILIIVVVAGLGIGYGWERYQEGKSDRAWKEWEKEVMKPYYEDTYGGDTPEETWQMFLDALRKEDLDLAAKYFVIDKQSEWRENLYQIKEAGYLEMMISDLTENSLRGGSVGEEGVAYYTIGDGDQVVIATVIFYKNINNKWKVDSL